MNFMTFQWVGVCLWHKPTPAARRAAFELSSFSQTGNRCVFFSFDSAVLDEQLFQVHAKFVKSHDIRGFCAQRFHTVLYTKNAVYTFGLNAGQLG